MRNARRLLVVENQHGSADSMNELTEAGVRLKASRIIAKGDGPGFVRILNCTSGENELPRESRHEFSQRQVELKRFVARRSRVCVAFTYVAVRADELFSVGDGRALFGWICRKHRVWP